MYKMLKILMIDDDVSFLKIYGRILEHNGYGVSTATDGTMALELLSGMNPDIVICDVVMSKMNGIEVLKKIKEKYPDIVVIMLTGEGSVEGAVEAMKQGAYTYMIKPVEIDQLLLNTKKAEEFLILRNENKQLKTQLMDTKAQTEFIGSSPQMQTLIKAIQQVAPTESTALILGESGTGKEIVANLIHFQSKRKDGPFIKVNCSALAENLLESELFGHEKGAFTGAVAAKKGRFEMAQGGTLFLDEIAELSMPLQSKLLRVLQEQEIERVGGTQTIKVDFRLICATNKDLKEEIEKGLFREDLYFRINVVPLHIAPLRERKEDILQITNYYLDYYCNEMGKPPLTLSDEAEACLLRYAWRGNIRELKNMAERIVVFSNGGQIQPSMLPEEIRDVEQGDFASLETLDFRTAKAVFEKKYLETMLAKNQWNITMTAEEIGIARKNLQAKIKQLEIEKSDTKR